MSNKSDTLFDIIHNIINKNYPVLDIGTKNGSTGYLDFITYSDVHAPVSKGCDQYGRHFFVIRAKIIKSDGSVSRTLETFFQRYSNNKNVWHGCGHVGPYFMSTEGGMTTNQARFLENLLENGRIDLTEYTPEELYNELRFGSHFLEYTFEDTEEKLVTIELD